MSPAAAVAPQDVGAEVSVLGACLQDFEAASKTTEILRAGDYHNEALRANEV
jgi:replicative DNA helicase